MYGWKFWFAPHPVWPQVWSTADWEDAAAKTAATLAVSPMPSFCACSVASSHPIPLAEQVASHVAPPAPSHHPGTTGGLGGGGEGGGGLGGGLGNSTWQKQRR
jgi:hypothetical protein